MNEEELGFHMRMGRDPAYFAENVLGVKLNPAQRRWFRLVAAKYARDEGGFPAGWEWSYKRVVHVAANQIGKTLGLAILLLWAGHYKIGVNPANWDFWLSNPYKWYHLAPEHKQSLYVLKDIVLLLTGTHQAQFDKETGKYRSLRYPEGLATEVKFDAQYPGIKFWNGSEIHFRTSDDKAKGIQGVRADGVSFDEAAYESHLLEIMEATISMRLVASGGPLLLVSTPDGMNDYYEVVTEILNEGFNTFHDRVWEAPLKKWALVWSEIQDNIGFGISEEEAKYKEEIELAGSDKKEQALRGAFLEPSDAYFTPGEEIKQSWIKNLAFSERPEDGHRYVIFWDPSGTKDALVAYVLDVTRQPWVLKWEYYWSTPPGFRTMLSEMFRIHVHWSTPSDGRRTVMPPRSLTGFDSTSMGGVFIQQELQRLAPKRALNFAGTGIKRNILSNARACLSKHMVRIPAAAISLQREVLNYREKDDKIVQDRVMCLAGALQLAVQGFTGVQSKKFRVGVPALDWRDSRSR